MGSQVYLRIAGFRPSAPDSQPLPPEDGAAILRHHMFRQMALLRGNELVVVFDQELQRYKALP
jgi:hypothetical protein